VKRQCEILGIPEVQTLEPGLDFRLPQYRREVFLRFYEFHLENASHPGCVYYAMPWLIKQHKLDEEQRYWLAFLNGNTQNIVTTWLLFKRFPNLPSSVKERVALGRWFDENYKKLAWDTDRRYHKKDFLKSVDCYNNLTSGTQARYFKQFEGSTEEDTFDNLWKALRKDFYTFGRLSSFSYSEYLRIIGFDVQCSTLFFEDMGGSKSHRNGLAKVLGRDDRDWHQSTQFDGKYPAGEITWLKKEAEELLNEASVRIGLGKHSKATQRAIGYFTLESALCTYKSWHRKNRRYPNVYNDMFFERILHAETKFAKDETALFWDCREDCTPKHLLLEFCPNDPGLVSEKQNHYRETGEAIMMSKRWPEFDNPFDRKAWSK
jgi:hypothetical protein